MTWTMADTLALLLTVAASQELACLALGYLGPVLERCMSMERLDGALRAGVFSGLILAPALGRSTGGCGHAAAPGVLWMILAVWLAGSLYQGVFWHLGKVRLLRQVERMSGQCGDGEIADLKEGMAAWLDVKGGVAVYSGGLIPTPYTRGVLRKRIYLSDEVCTRDEWKLLLTHELIHCRRNDCLYRGALLLLRAAFWFCPHVGRFADYAVEVNEMSCDERVLRERPRGSRGSYCRLLVRMRQNTGTLLGAYLGGDGDSLERRLRRLIQVHREERTVLAAMLAAGTALLVPAVTVVMSALINQCLL